MMMKRAILISVVMHTAIFAFSQTKTEMKPSELPKGVSSYLSKNFSGYGVDKAFKIDNKGVLSTEVMVTKGGETLVLTFDKDVRLVKKQAIKPDTKALPVKDERKPLPPVKK
jgi:hypothetical protein